MSYPGDGWFEVRELPGIRVHVLSTGQFKTISAKLAVRLPLHPPAVTANALVPFVLRRGTRRLPTSQAITRALESMYGARVHVEVGKVGEVQLVEVRGEAVADRFIPGGVAGNGQLQSLLRLLLEVLYDPALQGDGFLPTYVHQERELLRRRIEGIINNKPQYAVYRLYEEMFRGEPFALHRLGRREDLEAIEPGSLFRHYLEQLVPRRAELAVVGPVAPDEVAELVQRLSGGLAFVPRPELADPPPCQVDRDPAPAPSGWREVSETQDVRQEVLALGFRTRVHFRSPQYPGLMLYNGLLGGFPHSRLFVHVRERHSLAYFAYSRLEPTKGVLVVSAGIDPSRRGQVLDVIAQQLNELACGRIQEDELEATRRGTARRLLVACDEPWALLEHWTVGMVNGLQRPVGELLNQVGQVGRDHVVEAAASVRQDTLYVLTCRPQKAGQVEAAATAAATPPPGQSGAAGGGPDGR